MKKLPIYRQNLSNGLYARYYKETMVDGEGVRNSLYVSGCLFNCIGCYNKSIQDFKAGTPYDLEIENKILEDLAPDYVQGLSLVGGEPLLNLNILNPLLVKVRDLYKDSKDIWSWTGFTWEELMEITALDDEDALKIKQYLGMIDVLIDGRFEQTLFKTNLQFKGSTNQRIINVKESLNTGSVVLWNPS